MYTLTTQEISLIESEDLTVSLHLKNRAVDAAGVSHLHYVAFLFALDGKLEGFAVKMAELVDFSQINLTRIDEAFLQSGEHTLNPFTQKPTSTHLGWGAESNDSPVFILVAELEQFTFPLVEENLAGELLTLHDYFSEIDHCDSITDLALKQAVEAMIDSAEDWLFSTPLGKQLVTQSFIIPDGFGELTMTVAFHPSPKAYAEELSKLAQAVFDLVEQ